MSKCSYCAKEFRGYSYVPYHEVMLAVQEVRGDKPSPVIMQPVRCYGSERTQQQAIEAGQRMIEEFLDEEQQQ